MNNARDRGGHARERRKRARKEAKVSPLLMTTFPQVASGISFGKLKQTATLCMALLYAAFLIARECITNFTYFKQKNGLKCSNLGQKLRGEKNHLLLNRCY